MLKIFNSQHLFHAFLFTRCCDLDFLPYSYTAIRLEVISFSKENIGKKLYPRPGECSHWSLPRWLDPCPCVLSLYTMLPPIKGSPGVSATRMNWMKADNGISVFPLNLSRAFPTQESLTMFGKADLEKSPFIQKGHFLIF